MGASEITATNLWLYPTKIQETIRYVDDVRRLYVRHIVTRTKEMAVTIVQRYVNGHTDVVDDRMPVSPQQQQQEESTWQQNPRYDPDPFRTLAKQISDCPWTQSDQGRIGWIRVFSDVLVQGWINEKI
jgi:hypothetical protein